MQSVLSQRNTVQVMSAYISETVHVYVGLLPLSVYKVFKMA
jgi:hypothetical protein